MRFQFVALLILVALELLAVREGSCGNVDITNIQLGTLSGGSTTVTFDITWANSWRSTEVNAPAPNNWDAAWVFMKFRKNGGDWTHASLDNTGHSAGSGTAAAISVGYPDTSSAFNISTNPGVGVFIYRSGDGTGTFSITGAGLSWNYSQDGVTSGDTVDVRLFAVEMVYIPQGAFFAGDNSTAAGSFRQGSSDNDPWYISSESAITTADIVGSGTGVGETAAEYYYVTDSSNFDDATASAFTIPAQFPKGYQAFYMMKGEISQGQWVAFFNTLTSTQKTARDITSATGKASDDVVKRNGVSWTSGDASTPDRGGGITYATVAMNYIGWADFTAYLDWAGLRPMSELEYERASRGPYRSRSGEYAWGSTSITQATSITDGGKANEAANASANCVYGNNGSVLGPMRVGAMAYGHATRVASGSGSYGVMDLSGNLWEHTIAVGMSTGRAFEGRYHGNGSLGSTGNHNVTKWPASGGNGYGFRGGSWSSSASTLRTSDRSFSALTWANRDHEDGGRGVRVAP